MCRVVCVEWSMCRVVSNEEWSNSYNITLHVDSKYNPLDIHVLSTWSPWQHWWRTRCYNVLSFISSINLFSQQYSKQSHLYHIQQRSTPHTKHCKNLTMLHRINRCRTTEDKLHVTLVSHSFNMECIICLLNVCSLKYI